MKNLLFFCILSVPLFMIVMIPASAQEKGQKKMHVVIEENGAVITDTTVIFGSDVPEEEIQAAISGITGEKGHPCPAHHQPAVHCDTMIYKCRHLQKSELDSLLEASGTAFAFTHADTCRHTYAPCEKRTEKAEAGQQPCKHMHKEIIRMGEHGGKEIVIIEKNGDVIIREGQIPGGKCIKVILENFDGSGENVIEEKVIITEEGEKAEKAIIIESPAETSKKAEKEE